MKQPDELGSRQFNPYIGFVEIIGNGRPDPFRTVCNSVILGLAVLVFGIPHFLVIAKFWRDRDIGASYFVHYAWTLIWWFLVLAAPCLVFVRNREAKARRLARESEH